MRNDKVVPMDKEATADPRLWMPGEPVPDEVMAVMPDERSFSAAQELFSGGMRLDDEELYAIVNDRRRDVFSKHKEGFYMKHPEYLAVGREPMP
jgi:hypothetical protein